MKTYTHKGKLIADARSRDMMVYLRETKNFWITPAGMKFRKQSGSGMGEWPTYHLQMESITPLKTPVEK